MLNKISKKLVAVISIAMTCMITSTVVGTLAAFVGSERHNQDITIDLGYQKYFGDGSKYDSKTGISTYYIDNPEHLRSLSRLVGMGAFGPKDEFILRTSFNWTGKDLIPIGSDHTPFRSIFKGVANDTTNPQNVTYITNLSVVGNNLMDVGMFGYVSNEGSISNFVLNTPIVKSTGSNTFSYETMDKNPLRKTFTKNICKTISMTPTYKNGDQKQGATAFTFNTSSLPKTYEITSGGKTITTNYEYSYVISNPNIATYDASTNKLTIDTSYAGPTDAADKKDGEYFTMSISVSGLVAPSNANDMYRYATFAVETFKFYYNYKDKVVVTENGDSKVPTKMINTDSKAIQQGSAYRHLNNEHGLYVGVVAGHLDGNAENIGVYSPKLDIGRPFISNSLLIGKRIDDDDLSTLSKEDITFGTTNPNDPDYIKLGWKYIDPHMKNYYNDDGSPKVNADVGQGNRIVKGIYGKHNTFTENSENILRIYGTNNGGNENLDVNKGGYTVTIGGKNKTVRDSTVFTSHNVYTDSSGKIIKPDDFDASKINEYASTKLQGISFTDNLDASLMNYKKAILLGSICENLRVNNGIQMWVSAADNRGVLEKLFNSGIDFYLTFEFDYLFFDNDATVHSENSTSNKRICILGTRKYIDQTSSGLIGPVYGYYEPPHANKQQTIFGSNTSPLDELFATGQTIEQNDTPFESATYENPKYENPTVSNNFEALLFRNSKFKDPQTNVTTTIKEIAGPVPTVGDTNTYAAQTRQIRIRPQKKGLDFRSKIFPMVLVGMYDQTQSETPNLNPGDQGYKPPVYTDYELCILGFRMMISDLKGNFSQTIGSVDFTGTANQLPYKKGVFNSSNARVTAKTLANDYTNNTSTPEDLHVAYEATNVTNYVISVSRDSSTYSNKVTVTYTITGAPNGQTAFDYILPTNTDGFTPATIKAV